MEKITEAAAWTLSVTLLTALALTGILYLGLGGYEEAGRQRECEARAETTGRPSVLISCSEWRDAGVTGGP